MRDDRHRSRMSRRLRCFALAGLTIIVGLLVHLRGAALGPVVRDVLGDALWAAMVTWLIGALMLRASLGVRSAVAYGICMTVELSQLYHAPGLDVVRETRLGHLVLGSGFDPRDLMSYALGVGGAAIIERVLQR